MNTFFLHINNHVNRKSYDKMTSSEKKKAKPSYTIVGELVNERTFYFGVATCSVQDTFSKEIGRRLALENKDKTGGHADVPQYVLDNRELGRYFVAKAKRLVKTINFNNGKTMEVAERQTA